MKLDVYSHIFPSRFYSELLERCPGSRDLVKLMYSGATLINLDQRFRLMDQFGDYAQVLCLSGPPLESLGSPALACELARIANDDMSKLVSLYPHRFPAFVASLPMNDTEGLLREAVRAIDELGAVGVQVYSNVNGRPLTSSDTLPLFDLMAERDLPMWLHPERQENHADYAREPKSRYETWFILGWPFETSVAMADIAFSGLFDKHPGLKIIAHQMGGAIPFLQGRISANWNRLGTYTVGDGFEQLRAQLKRRPVEYLEMFYADTALAGAVAPARCGVSFFGPDRVLFATDAPFGAEEGAAYIRGAIGIVESLDVTPEQRRMIYAGSARKLLGLD